MPSFAVRTPQLEYQAHVERGIAARAQAFLPPNRSKVFVVTTEAVWRHQGHRLSEGFADTAFTKLVLPSGEEHKRLVQIERLACEMASGGADRLSLVVAFGGGVVTDMAGFLAAIFMRGIPVLQVPTTLLAQVDAAVGGKTGANLAVGKNLIGCFHPPAAVLIDPAMVDSLPEREYVAGLYEVIKHGVIASEPLFALLESRRERVLAREAPEVDEMVRESVRIKAEVVTADEREHGIRKSLNFGHTFGHALEAETGYTQFLHGEAVGWGMLAAVELADLTGMLCRQDANRIRGVVRSYGAMPSLEAVSPEAIFSRLAADKKTQHGRVHFVLPMRIGEVAVRSDVPENAVRQAILRALA
ncbi:MAG: 3-dehydroquinate synthase [Acidobacteriota bacterium]|nr:3-dehydroquinate synthase [Acidobacteriota bacterium]